MTVIMKFGGSCFVDPAAFARIREITDIYKNERKIFVASALNGITDKLIDVANKAQKHDNNGVLEVFKIIEKQHTDTIESVLNDKPDLMLAANKYIKEKLIEIQSVLEEIEEFKLEPYFKDYVISFGEKMSTYLLYLYMLKCGYNVQFFTGEELIITDDNYTDALPDLKYTFGRIQNKLAPLLKDSNDDTIFVVTGFIGRNKMGYTTTLGRGGSDFTATILARAIFETANDKTVRVILWKDVDGILTANPKFVKNPQLIRKLNYDEAKESAFFGAKILHPKCLSVIENQRIKVEIKNFNNPLEQVHFSVISDETDSCVLKGVSMIEKVSMINVNSGTLVNVPGVLGKIFTLMGENGISVSMVAQSSSEVNTTFVVDYADGQKAVDLLKADSFFKPEWFQIQLEPVGIIAVIGCQIHDAINKAKIFTALGKLKLEVKGIAQSSDGMNVSIIVASHKIKDAVNAINEEFTISI